MSRIALFPGTFDPFTLGHVDIIKRALPLFDKIYIGIGRNANKEPMFSEEQRLQWVQEMYKNEERIDSVLDLIYQFVYLLGIALIVIYQEKEKRGWHPGKWSGKLWHHNIEAVFLTCLPQFTSVASTLVRDVIRNGGDASPFLPEIVAKTLVNYAS